MDVIERTEQKRDVEVEPLKFLTPGEVRYVADVFGTPAYVYDEATLESNARYMTGLPNPFGLTVRYSLKACQTAAIVRLFDRMGLSFDASSIWEVRRAIGAGVGPSKILLTGQEAGDGTFDLVRQGMKFDAGSLRQLDDYGRAFPGSEVSVLQSRFRLGPCQASNQRQQ
jgi:diaminopimelate decarboxylase